MKAAMQPIFSNDLRSAFITAVVEAFQKHYRSKYLGRTALQKLTYFSKVVGVPVPCSFVIYNYGPYSDEITFAVDSMLADEVLLDQSPDSSKYSNYKPGPNSSFLMSRFHAQLKPYLNRIDSVVSVLGKFNPSQLELIATLHFIDSKLTSKLERAPSRNEVLAEFFLIKGSKFSKTQAESYYEALKKAKLI